jgi:tryptophan synthase beta chain
MAKKFPLPDADLPTRWYNVIPDIPGGLEPPLDPETKQPAGPEKLAPIFPEGLLEQEMSPEPWIEIPEEVREILALWRPTPLVRATALEEAIGTKSRIYYKYEGVSPAGSHKVNSSVAQAYYNAREGVKRLATETGAGQWGSALSFATQKFNLECMVYMVRCSFEQKPYRKSMMRAWNAEVIPSPSDRTAAGRQVLAEYPDTPGSLGIAISEAVEDAALREDTKYALGSVLNHVCLHQTVIGQEARQQLQMAGEELPDIVVGCCGGGSNFAGLAHPFVPDHLEGRNVRFVGVEPTACPTLTRGRRAYDFGDVARQTPLLYMYTLGHDFVPPSIHAGGLRYHGMSPIISALVRDGIIEPMSVHQTACFEAGILFARTEGILPAPEANHAIRAAIDLATVDKDRPQVILFNLSGHGLLDLASYDRYLAGELEDYEYPTEEIDRAMKGLPVV